VTGLLETVLVTEGRIRLLERHLERLARSGAPPDAVLEARAAFLAAAAAATGPIVLRVDVSDDRVQLAARAPRGAAPVGLQEVPGYDPARRDREAKRADRDWAIAAEAALAPGEEALLVSGDGLVGETTRANVFAVIDGVLVTPPARGLLAGVTRGWVIERTGAREREITAGALATADAAFLTTAGRGVVPVRGRSSTLVEELAREWLAL
jgi:branched-chain amino acid aminotransferase